MMIKLIGGAFAFCVVATAIALSSQPSAPPAPDVNAICGPAITGVLDQVVHDRMLTPVNLHWDITNGRMTVDGIYAAGQQSYHIIVHCSVLNGAPHTDKVEA
jgi:hypothetical protein